MKTTKFCLSCNTKTNQTIHSMADVKYDICNECLEVTNHDRQSAIASSMERHPAGKNLKKWRTQNG